MRANSSRSVGKSRRLDILRSRRRVISSLSCAVLMLQLFYLGSELVGFLDLRSRAMRSFSTL